ncbi:MAG: NAD(+) diphosphatase [Alphaproteobacteria bacterium]|nr:NAD(+) diphosphatase [Alphaproteobacteria bacterium]
MRAAEQVTFGGGGLDRATHLRKDTDALAAMLASPTARILPVWRGKPLIAPQPTGKQDIGLAFLAADHMVFADANEAAVFLGLDGQGPIFARDISAWSGPDTPAADLGSLIDQSEQRHPALPQTQYFAELRHIMARLTPAEAELIVMAQGLFAWHRFHRFCANCGHLTEITQAGWQRTCPACNRQHFPRTDPVVIMLITKGNKLLIGRSPNWLEGMYSLLAGFMEPGETVEAAVRREVYEETQVRVGAVGYLASQPWPFPSSLMIGCWGHATSDEITIDEVEIEDAKWVTREELTDSWANQSSVLIAARKGAIAHFLIKNWLSDTLS